MTENKTEIFGIGKHKVLEEFTPDRKYITKLIISTTLIFLGFILTIYAVTIPILWDNYGLENLGSNILFASYFIVGIGITSYVIILIFIFPYFNAISYTFTTQEIVVNKGFLVKRTKIVPYRNITNFVMYRGILDRLLGGENFGSIQVETAGQGPQQSHPEQRLVGIMGVSEYTEKIRNILSKMKGQAAISTDTETASSLDEEELLAKILGTLQEISSKL